QALDWLRADLALRTRQLETGNPADRAAVQRALRRWQGDSYLAGIRDRAALAKLPAQEQKAFTQLWADVAALLQKPQKQAQWRGPPARGAPVGWCSSKPPGSVPTASELSREKRTCPDPGV